MRPKSKSLIVLSAFAVIFGGVLALAVPAQAVLGDCYVEVEPDPSAPSPQSTPVVVPTTCPTTPPPVVVTTPVPVTVVVTRTVTKIVYVDRTITPSAPPTTSSVPSEIPALLKTPVPPATSGNSTNNGNLFFWGAGVAGLLSAALTTVGVVGVIRRRRYQGAHVAPEGDDWYDVSDYGEQDETAEIPVVREVVPPQDK